MSEKISLHIEHAGLQTSIQDLGRPGYQAQGIPIGGALDRRAAIQANYLVGNQLNEPLLEVTLLGPKITFEQAAQIALTGADLSAQLDGQDIPMYQTITVPAGAALRFGKPQSGCRAYLAVGGKWLVKKWLDSASLATQQAELLTPESLLKKKQRIDIRIQPFVKPRMLQPEPPKTKQDCFLLEVLPGPEFERFTRKDIAHFFAQSYTVTPSSNRMGYRLDPGLINYAWDQENISSGIVPGTIQITNNGQPIVLMADAQTIGGYPRIANLSNESISQMAQLRPGDKLRFRLKEKVTKE